MTQEDFKYPFYIKEANPEGVAELLPILKEFYGRYPSGNEVGEALHQLRREFNLIQEKEEKKKEKKHKVKIKQNEVKQEKKEQKLF